MNANEHEKGPCGRGGGATRGGWTARGRGVLPRPKEAMSRPMPPGGTYAGGGTPGTVRARGVWNDLWTGY